MARTSFPRPALVALLGVVTSAVAGDDSSQTARAKAMHTIAQAVAVRTNDGAKVEPVEEPAYRWDDPARRFGDGTVWVYGKSGRPAALLTLSFNQNPQSSIEWLHELTALTNTRFSAASPDGWNWSPQPGMAFQPIPGAPASLYPTSRTSKPPNQLRATESLAAERRSSRLITSKREQS